MKTPIVIIWLVCLVSSLTDWLEVESKPAYVPGRPIANMKAFARECVAREIGTVKPIKWLKMLDLRQGHIPKTMKVTFTDFSSASVNFIKCLAELQANANKNETYESNQCSDVKTENEYLKSLISGFVVNPSPSQTVSPVFDSPTSTLETSSATPTTTCPTHPTESSLEDCQFVKVENTLLKQHLENCQSFPHTCDSSSTDTPSTVHTPSSITYVWFGFFIGFFVGCLFVIFINSSTYKKIKTTCCKRKKSVEEREKEMNTVTNKKEEKKEGKKEEKRKEKTQTNKKTETNQTTEKNQKEEISWENKNKLKQELNMQKPPPRQKRIVPLPTVNLIELNMEEMDKNKKVINKTEKVDSETEKIDTEKNEVSKEKEKIMIDSVAIMIENV